MQYEIVELPERTIVGPAIRGGDCVASVARAWEEIWADEELTAKRAYTVGFEAYLPGEDRSCAGIDVYAALR